MALMDLQRTLIELSRRVDRLAREETSTDSSKISALEDRLANLTKAQKNADAKIDELYRLIDDTDEKVTEFMDVIDGLGHNDQTVLIKE